MAVGREIRIECECERVGPIALEFEGWLSAKSNQNQVTESTALLAPAPLAPSYSSQPTYICINPAPCILNEADVGSDSPRARWPCPTANSPSV